jgi:hypothetical protein
MKFLSIKVILLSGITLACQIVNAEETKITIGGEIKFDGYFDTSTNNSTGPRGYDLLSFRSVPLENSSDSDKVGGTKFHARGTKLSIGSATPYEGGTIKTYFEGDFLGRIDSGADTDDDTVSNSYEFRVRQAYMSWGNWTVGQTWSNFVDLKAYPEGITFSSTLGRGFVRQAQVKYSYQLGEGDSFSFSLENPDTDYNAGTPVPGSNANESDGIPDMIATYFNKMGASHIRASLLLRSLGVDETGSLNTTDVTAIDAAQSDSTTGWGIGLSGKYVVSPSFNIKFNLHGGDGIGRYLYNNQFRSATFVDGVLETETAWGGNAMVQYKPSKELRLNLGYGGHTVDVEADYVVGSVTETLTALHGNAIWTIAPGLEFGTGFTYATRAVKSGDEGDITRLMISFKRKFKATF